MLGQLACNDSECLRDLTGRLRPDGIDRHGAWKESLRPDALGLYDFVPIKDEVKVPNLSIPLHFPNPIRVQQALCRDELGDPCGTSAGPRYQNTVLRRRHQRALVQRLAKYPDWAVLKQQCVDCAAIPIEAVETIEVPQPQLFARSVSFQRVRWAGTAFQPQGT